MNMPTSADARANLDTIFVYEDSALNPKARWVSLQCLVRIEGRGDWPPNCGSEIIMTVGGATMEAALREGFNRRFVYLGERETLADGIRIIVGKFPRS